MPPIILGLAEPFISTALAHGVSASILAFLILLPVVATLVAFSRHVVGITGFSIFAPVGLTLVFLSTGVIPGIILFVVMLAIAALGKKLISYLKLEYIPRSAMLLWFVALGFFLLLILEVYIPALSFIKVELFSLLLLVILVEDFMAPLSGLRWGLILERSLQIMILAIIGALFVGNLWVQQFALRNPEIVVVLVALANIAIGRYLGLRLTEYFRFRPLMDAEE